MPADFTATLPDGTVWQMEFYQIKPGVWSARRKVEVKSDNQTVPEVRPFNDCMDDDG